MRNVMRNVGLTPDKRLERPRDVTQLRRERASLFGACVVRDAPSRGRSALRLDDDIT
jgi:hypothetical protein